MTIGSAANSYEILSKLAEGGMAELFLARAAAHGTGVARHVVLKRIAKSRATDTQYVQMFLDEARLAAQLRHPNIAQVFDIGRLGASYFFTMEYVHGVTVQHLLQTASDLGMALPLGAVLAIVAGTAAGLEHAHQRVGLDGKPLGIVHRDISPSNLIISFEGHLKVVDFGVAKAMGRPETQAGEIKGKVGYLSPEQCRLQKIDRRSDLYSLGVVLWEMLTLDRLWQRDSAFETLAAIATEVPPRPSTKRPDVPIEVDALTLKLLTLDPADRFQSAQEVVDAVELVAQRTKVLTSPQQLARLLRELFGSPPEPWLALADQEISAISVTATPLPPDESIETFDEDEGSVSDVELKLTSVFRAATNSQDASATNVRALRAPSADMPDETREVPALSRATSVGEAPPLTPPPVIVVARPQDPTLMMREQPDDEMPTQRPLDPRPEQTILGAGDPPMRLPSVPAFAPAPGSFGRPVPLGAPTAPVAIPIPGSGPRPSAPLVGSGPRPSLPFVDRGDRPSLRALPRHPPPPHGSRPMMHWWIIGGSVLGVVLVILVLVLRSESPTRSDDAIDASIVIIATQPDAAVALDATAAVTDAAAVLDANAIDDAAVATDAVESDDLAELENDKKKPKPPRVRTRLRTKPELNAAFRDERYQDIVAACIELGSEGERAVVCTLAACRAHDKVAQDWYRNVAPKQREGTIQICKQSGHPITDVCSTDLLACRK